MPANRFYFDVDLNADKLTLQGDELKHLKVMRLREKDPIEIINGKGMLAKANILFLSSKELEVEITSLKIEKKNQRNISLAQAYPKTTKLELIIEKGTELGAEVFYLFPSDLSENPLKQNKLDRLHTIMICAMKQCGRLYLPEIIEIPSLDAFKNIEGNLFFGDVTDSCPFFSEHLKNDAIFFIGPEKGFSNKEVLYLKEELKAKGVKLNNNILRTETAGLCAISIYFCIPSNPL